MSDDRKPSPPPPPKIRPAHDAEHDRRLQRDPADEDAKLDIALDESFPSSDPPSITQPHKGKDTPPPVDDEEEGDRIRSRLRATD